jgi:hypothetical protein
MKPRALHSRLRPAFLLTQVEDEEGRIHILIRLPIEEDGDRWCLWRPDHAGFDSRSIFEGALVKEGEAPERPDVIAKRLVFTCQTALLCR